MTNVDVLTLCIVITTYWNHFNIYHYPETCLHDFREILKRYLQNFEKIVKNVSPRCNVLKSSTTL